MLLGHSGPNHMELGRIAEFKDIDTLAPDTERQLQELDTILGIKKIERAKPRLEKGDGKLMKHMGKRLRTMLEHHPLGSLPAHVRPYWKAFFRYLQGTQELELPLLTVAPPDVLKERKKNGSVRARVRKGNSAASSRKQSGTRTSAKM
jgi:hypothetical protein